MLAILGAFLVGILSAGTGIKDWLELLKNDKESKPEIKIEISSGDLPQISTGKNSRSIQIGGGDYIEKLEISLSVQDNAFKQQAGASGKLVVRKTEKIRHFDWCRSRFVKVCSRTSPPAPLPAGEGSRQV